MAIYRTVDGDMVDAICHERYGDESMTEAVYEANPGLAQLGPILPRGIEIDLPDVPEPKPRSPIRLWG